MIDYRRVKQIYFYTKEIDMMAGMNRFQILLSCNFSPIETLLPYHPDIIKRFKNT